MTEIFNIEKFDVYWANKVQFSVDLDYMKKVAPGDTILVNALSKPPAFYKILLLKRNLNQPKESQLEIKAEHLFDAIGYHVPTLNAVFSKMQFSGNSGVEIGDIVMVCGKRHEIIEINNLSITVRQV